MKYVYDWQFNRPAGAKLLRVERNVANPLPGLSFVSVAIWQVGAEKIGVVF